MSSSVLLMSYSVFECDYVILYVLLFVHSLVLYNNSVFLSYGLTVCQYVCQCPPLLLLLLPLVFVLIGGMIASSCSSFSRLSR